MQYMYEIMKIVDTQYSELLLICAQVSRHLHVDLLHLK